jgi:ZIP family zinc transporter
MSDSLKFLIILILPLAGTSLGAAAVYFLKKQMSPRLEKILYGFAAGVMIAASVWSLLIPAVEAAAEQGKISWLPAAAGFLLGIGFLLVLDSLIPHLHIDTDIPEGKPSGLKRSTMLILAVALHNIPEGMAVGVILAGMQAGNIGISLAGAAALSAGIALQNVPEGAIISVPLRESGLSKSKAFSYGLLSGIVEPIGAVITLLLTAQVISILPIILSFAAGAMIYVVVEELIPEAQAGEHTNIGTIGVALGFVLMMILDIAFG